MMTVLRPLLLMSPLLLLAAAMTANADPCGMVPPVFVGNEIPITRVGDQATYVFYKNGIETVVIRPGFEGKVDEFGMLIPFPSIPSLRKVSDNIFPHITKAIDPPEVVVYANVFPRPSLAGGVGGGGFGGAPVNDSLTLQKNEVRVVKEEAVGMYEVAVLEAGSAAALKKWVDEHGYQFPKGMENACNDYVELGWCFVAVKTKVGQKSGVAPKPGMRKVNAKLPANATFDGHVQAMGFRFFSKELVVPMRLSTFNKGDLHNIVYLLTDRPNKIRSIPAEYVVRQISGAELIKNVTQPLPLRIVGGTVKSLRPFQKKNLPKQREPVPHNGAARDLFATDLLAVQEGRLSHPHEESEKMLLRIGERLDLRGPEIDKLNEDSLAKKREKIVAKSLTQLKRMTLTVIDGNFPREILQNQNLTFSTYRMPQRRNTATFYDAKTKKPAAKQQGRMYYGKISTLMPASPTKQVAQAHNTTPAITGVLALFSCVLIGSVLVTRRRIQARSASE